MLWATIIILPEWNGTFRKKSRRNGDLLVSEHGRENSVEWGLLDNNARSKKKHGNAGRRFLKNMIVLRTLF